MADPFAERKMFSLIAPRYDLLNRLLSLGLDQYWRKATVSAMKLHAGDRALDLCCGTGDLAIELARFTDVLACDFSVPMLKLAQEKADDLLTLTAGDALAIPFATESFDTVTIAFGIRNLSDRALGFSEACRVLKPGGQLFALEFSRPRNWLMHMLHSIYVQAIIPLVGRLLSTSDDAYQYLADTIANFPEREFIVTLIQLAGFKRVVTHELSGGIVTIYAGTR